MTSDIAKSGCPMHDETWNKARLAVDEGREANHAVWRFMQRGLIYPSPHAGFALMVVNRDAPQPLTRETLGRLMGEVRALIHRDHGGTHTTAIVGVGLALWRHWCETENLPVPAGMTLLHPATEDGAEAPHRCRLFEAAPGTFFDSRADLWFHIKSDQPAHCEQVFHFILNWLNERTLIVLEKTVFQDAATKAVAPDKLGGKVLGCRFSENLNNPSDPLSIQAQTLIGFDDPLHLGASYVLGQRFRIGWDNILNMSAEQIEDLVGRTTDDIIIPSRDDRSHIKASRAQNEDGDTVQVLRLGLPFGVSAAVRNDDLLAKGATLRDEEGLFFAGYAASVQTLERVLHQQIGDDEGFLRDRLLTNVRADAGGLFYIPNQTDLGLGLVEVPALADLDWRRFPGVDWSRLDRHFTQRSANGLMFYNHKDYLYALGTMPVHEQALKRPPSARVQRLLADAFLRWQDNWYFDRRQVELGHLFGWVGKVYGAAEVERVMAMPVAERMGWVVRMTVGHACVDPEYGFRGRKQRLDGSWYNGADTYRIQPWELIAGALPNIGLGQGKYVMDYARENEVLPNFITGLSYASGVGHVVPRFERALELGLGGLKADVEARLAARVDETRRPFYQGALIALVGIAEHLAAYAKLAGEMADALPATEIAERVNLLTLQARLSRLTTERPATLLEAAQLIFTLHACLHLVGEPTAIGRLDQMLHPFHRDDLAAGRVTEAEAQEIIDCFWLKIGEKVQPNRLFVEDHQPYGNLAVGGTAGNYPQGAANNQWVQQVTVGGTDPDGNPADNPVTLLCLRAARRLPLNAPCLSLRVRADTAREVLEEAALAILSGGAHPILLNDDKIIPGLAASGDRVGQGRAPTEWTPVAEKAGGTWNSAVSLRDARDYAADGCYEPQLSGKSWFTLGGVNTLQALEAAMNQGKSWALAGPQWFRGQRVSFTSERPEQIRTYEALEDLVVKHARWIYAKQANGLIATYGQMQKVCPSPLLSVLVEGCLEKGLDFYEGGPLYNAVAPGLTAIPNLVNALWAIRTMVYDKDTAVTSLPELTQALICDWGWSMTEPFISTLAGPARIAAQAERYKRLRAVALALPRYGRGHHEIDAFGDRVAYRLASAVVEVFTDPAPSMAEAMVKLARRLGTVERPFGGFQIQPGVGTFENYVEFGAQTGASADGRRNGQPLASDYSPAASPADLPAEPQAAPFLKVLSGYGLGDGSKIWSDGAPVDLNIREDFPKDKLVEVLSAFAKGHGGNILTITCANPETMAGAARDPEKYDLLRVRMGGWSEFFVAMFPAHQEQHQRRPLNTP